VKQFPAYPVINIRESGRNIRRICREQGYTANDLREYLYLADERVVWRWWSGRSLPNLSNLCALSALLKVTVNEMLVFEDEKSAGS